jgi:hypothetical protein
VSQSVLEVDLADIALCDVQKVTACKHEICKKSSANPSGRSQNWVSNHVHENSHACGLWRVENTGVFEERIDPSYQRTVYETKLVPAKIFLPNTAISCYTQKKNNQHFAEQNKTEARIPVTYARSVQIHSFP